MNQSERLDFLLEKFIEDSEDYKSLSVPENDTDKKRMLRSLMNVRLPKEMDPQVIEIQDEYLQERMASLGIVHVDDIPTIGDIGSSHPYAAKLSIWQGDITRLNIDAIVNAANKEMLGCFMPMHNCIDNCIHTYAGVQLRTECFRRMKNQRIRYGNEYSQPTSVPLITNGYNLPAKKIIHIVGPVVESKVTPEIEQALSDCYTNALNVCVENGLRTVAFCCLSTGVFRFPNDVAANIAVNSVSNWLFINADKIDRVIFNVFKDIDKALYENILLYAPQ